MADTTPGEVAVDLAAPRFDLRFRSGRGELRLRRPIQVFPATIEALTLAMRLPKRFELGRGTEALRHRRSKLEEATVELRWRMLAQAAAGGGVQLRLRGLRGGRLAVALRDEGGVLSAELDVLSDGSDAVFALTRLDWVREAPRPALERLRELADRLGIRWEAADGVFRMTRPLRRLLAEALLPAGYRLPEERARGLRLQVRRRGVTLLAEDRSTPADLDRHRRRMDDPPPWLRAALEGGLPPSAGEEPESLPSPWLRGDAVRQRLETVLVSERRPLEEAETDALLDALWLHPRDVGGWRDWARRLGERRDPAVLRVARAVLDLPIAEREPLLVEALSLAAAAGVPGDALEETLERAEAVAPASPHLWALRASLAGDDGADSVELWTRAADAVEVEDGTLAARWRRLAAERMRRLRGPKAALPLARRASAAAPDDIAALVLHAELIEATGDEDETLAALYVRLLDLEPDDETLEAVWERGLARAATWFVRRDEPDRARPFLAAMEDRVPFPTDAGVDVEDGALDVRQLEMDLDSGELSMDGMDGEDSDDDFDSGDFARPEPVPGEPSDEHHLEEWPRSEVWDAPPKNTDDDADEDWSPSEVWDAEPRLADREEEASEGPESGTHEAPSSEMLLEPQVTQVGVADEEMRELLAEVEASDDPLALLEGALEGAIEDDDDPMVRRVLAALDRVEASERQPALRMRALRWLAERSDL